MAPRVILGLRDLIEHVVESLDQLVSLAADTNVRTQLMEQNMATKVQLEAALASLQTAVTTKVQGISDQLAALTTAFNAFKAEDTTEDAAFQARIAELEAQLAQATMLTDDALAAINAATASIQATAPSPSA